MQPVMAQRIVNWQQGQQPPPYELMVCPTHRCNLRCGICARSWEENTDDVLFDELSDERWLRLIDEAGAMGVRYLNIGGGGEPTLRKDLVMKMCAKTKACGMEGHLQTNGTTLTRGDLGELINLKWYQVTISLDGPTAEINDAIRFKNAYVETVKRIQWVSALKKQQRALLPHLQINMVLTALNYHTLEAMVDFCIEHGVNLLSVKKLIEYSPDMRAFILNEEQNAALPDYVEKAIIRARGTRLTHNLDSLLPLQKEKERMPGSDGSENGKSVAAMPITSVWCLEPWRGLVVSSSGHVAPCCFFWDGEADSIRDKSLEEVWLGPYMTAFRAGMREGKLTGDCRKCGFPNSKDHRQLVECVKQAARTNGAWPGEGERFMVKAWNSLRRNGMRESLERFRQWRAIRRALRDEPK